MYVASWPRLVLTLKGFNYRGELVPRAYAHIDLPAAPGRELRRAYLYAIVRNEAWYHRWLPWLQPEPSALDRKEVERVIVRGEGR